MIDVGAETLVIVPSMEPRLFSHGYLVYLCWSWLQTGFHPSMEPRLFSHGYVALGSWPEWDEMQTPSMEPRLFSHGYSIGVTGNRSQKRLSLQWSHGFSAMDTAASERRNSPATDSRLPSMEPRLFSHGYTPGCTRCASRSMYLQWSHDLSAMDTRVVPVSSRFLNSLQWSHDLSAMDTTSAERCRVSVQQPSMEPRPFSHGYSGESDGWLYRIIAFNGATTFQPWIPSRSIA